MITMFLIFLFDVKINFTSFPNLHKKIESEKYFSHVETCDFSLSTHVHGRLRDSNLLGDYVSRDEHHDQGH